MKKHRLISIILVIQMVLTMCGVMTVNASPTPELFAYRIMTRSTVLKADTPIAYVFNERTDVSDYMPYFEGTTAMVPARFLAESFYAEHSWESAKGGTFVVEQRNCAVIRISAGKTITADGKEIKSDVLPIVKNGTLFVPAKEFAQAMRLYYVEDAENGLLFFSRESEEQRHAEIDCKRDIAPYFSQTNITNEKTYLYVATDGDDNTGDGSISKPFKTVERAKQEVRKLSQNQKGDIIVYLRGGIYNINEPIRFSPEDSGKNGFKIIYTSYEDETPVIEGTKEISGWKIYRGNIYVADVPDEESIHLVYEDGIMANKARYPNLDQDEPREGYLRSAGTNNTWYGLSWNEGEIPYIKNTKNLELFIWPGGTGGYWMWHSQVSALKDFNQKTRKMTMKEKASYEIGAGSRFYLMGAMEFLDREGEFYHDRDAGKLYYIPYGYSISGKNITIPVTERLIAFEGNSQTETVRNVEISKLELRNTKRTTNLARYSGMRMAESTGEAVKIIYAENCSILDCHIHDVGGNGILGAEYFGNIKISGNYIHDLALGGVLFNTLTAFRSSNNLISNNLVHSTSRILGQTIGIEAKGGGDTFIKNNRVYNIVRSAIQITEGQTGHSYVAYNDLSDSNVAAEDTGIIYTMTQKKGGTGSVVNNNFLHDSNAGFLAWSGIYSDEVSHDTVSQNNIITRMQTDGKDELGYYNAGIFAKGHDYKIINNVMANSYPPSQGSFTIMDSHEIGSWGYVIEKNITYNHGTTAYSTPRLEWTDRTVASADKNIFYAEGTNDFKVTDNTAKNLEDWMKLDGKGLDANSITEDPKFMNVHCDDFRLRYDSPAKAMGIKTIKQSTIGLLEDFKYADKNDEISRLFINREGYSDILSQMNLRSGQQTTVQVSARTKNGFVKKTENVSYTSDNPLVASVDASGIVTAKSAGKAKITATVHDGDSVASTDLYTFVDDELTELKFDKSTYLFEKDKEKTIIPVGITKFGQFLVGDEFDELGFTLENEDIASVDRGGNIIFNTNGSNELTAIARFNGKVMQAKTKLECVEYIISSIKLKLDSKTVKQGEEITAQLVGVDASGKEVPVDGYECNFASSDNGILEVQQQGTKAVIRGINAGKAHVSAKMIWLDNIYTITGNMTVTVPSRLMNSWKISNYGKASGFVLEDETGIEIYSNGGDVYRDTDDFTFVYKEENAEDLTIEASVVDVDSAPTSIASTGVMLRQENNAGSFNINLRYLPWSEVAIMTWRDIDNPNSKDVTIKDFEHGTPVKLRLQKKGNKIIASCMNRDGMWQVVREVDIDINGTYLAGVTGFSGNNDMWFISKVKDVKIYEGIE